MDKLFVRVVSTGTGHEADGVRPTCVWRIR